MTTSLETDDKARRTNVRGTNTLLFYFVESEHRGSESTHGQFLRIWIKHKVLFSLAHGNHEDFAVVHNLPKHFSYNSPSAAQHRSRIGYLLLPNQIRSEQEMSMWK